MGHLPQRVNAGISPAGTLAVELALSGDVANRTLELALHRPRVLLLLPSAVTCTSVLEDELESGHKRS
jgi:hypothetical protein